MMKGFFCTFLSLFLLGTPLTIQAVPQLLVSNNNPLVDEPISITITGLDPSQTITLKAFANDADEKLWGAAATFKADITGNINLDRDAPLSGSYDGVDSTGLFWSMAALSDKRGIFALPSDAITVSLQLFIENDQVASTTVKRVWSQSGVKKILVREDGLVGTLFIPNKAELAPVLITFNGSNGGVNEQRAELLAEHGFATLTLSYFAMEGQPSTLENISLEYFQKGFAWIKNRSDVDGSKIGILGGSKGGELVLLLGSMFPDSIQAIAAIVPSCAVYPGCAESNIGPAWTYQGKPLQPIAFMQHVEPEAGLDSDHPILLTNYFYRGIAMDPALFLNAAIKVENIKCPVMLISGGDDQMWPSGFFSEHVKERCQTGNVDCQWLNYPKAGHQIGMPYLPAPHTVSWHPVTKRWYLMGGSAKNNELAKQDYWPKMLQFFEDKLK